MLSTRLFSKLHRCQFLCCMALTKRLLYVFSNTIVTAPAAPLTVHDKPQSCLACSAAPPVASCTLLMSMPCAFFSFIDEHVCANYVFSNTIVAAPGVSSTTKPMLSNALHSTTGCKFHCGHVNANRPFFSLSDQHICAKASANEQLRAALSFK